MATDKIQNVTLVVHITSTYTVMHAGFAYEVTKNTAVCRCRENLQLNLYCVFAAAFMFYKGLTSAA